MMISTTFFKAGMVTTLTAMIAFSGPDALVPTSGMAWENHGSTVKIKPPREVELWFSALGKVDQKSFNTLIADDAKIILMDLGIEQTKQEFISSLKEWNRATRGAKHYLPLSNGQQKQSSNDGVLSF